MIGVPTVMVIKDRPLEPGHRLYATAPPGRRTKGQTCLVTCSCGARLAVALTAGYQAALDLAARNHRRHLL